MQGNFIMDGRHPLPLTYQDYFFNILGIEIPYNLAQTGLWERPRFHQFTE